MFNFLNLNEEIRSIMTNVIEQLQMNNEIYFSTRFNEIGKKLWVSLLKEAVKSHDEHWLAFEIEAKSLMKEFEGSKTPLGGYTIRHVPHTASETLADGQFNRIYMIAIATYALKTGKNFLTIYRAKQSSAPRPESKLLEGKTILASEVIEQLSTNNTSFKSEILKPNSGLSVKL